MKNVFRVFDKMSKRKSNFTILSTVMVSGEVATMTDNDTVVKYRNSLLSGLAAGCYQVRDIKNYLERGIEPKAADITPITDYPEVGEMDLIKGDDIDFNLWHEHLEILKAVGPSKYSLAGVYVEADYIIAIDGRRLIKSPSGLKLGDGEAATIDGAGLEIVKLGFTSCRVYVDIEGKKTTFSHDNLAISVRHLQGKYPNWKMFIPISFDSEITVDSDRLRAILRVNKEYLDKDTNKVIFTQDKGQLIVEVPGGPVFKTPVKNNVGKAAQFALNHSLLSAYLKRAQDYIMFTFNDPIQPFKIVRKENADTTFILMPMKVCDEKEQAPVYDVDQVKEMLDSVGPVKVKRAQVKPSRPAAAAPASWEREKAEMLKLIQAQQQQIEEMQAAVNRAERSELAALRLVKKAGRI